MYDLDPLNNSDATLDSDLDKLINLAEFLNSTNPLNQDTDLDTINDYWEIINNLDPLNKTDGRADFDSDGLVNYREYSPSEEEMEISLNKKYSTT